MNKLYKIIFSFFMIISFDVFAEYEIFLQTDCKHKKEYFTHEINYSFDVLTGFLIGTKKTVNSPKIISMHLEDEEPVFLSSKNFTYQDESFSLSLNSKRINKNYEDEYYYEYVLFGTIEVFDPKVFCEKIIGNSGISFLLKLGEYPVTVFIKNGKGRSGITEEGKLKITNYIGKNYYDFFNEIFSMKWMEKWKNRKKNINHKFLIGFKEKDKYHRDDQYSRYSSYPRNFPDKERKKFKLMSKYKVYEIPIKENFNLSETPFSLTTYHYSEYAKNMIRLTTKKGDYIKITRKYNFLFIESHEDIVFP